MTPDLSVHPGQAVATTLSYLPEPRLHLQSGPLLPQNGGLRPPLPAVPCGTGGGPQKEGWAPPSEGMGVHIPVSSLSHHW